MSYSATITTRIPASLYHIACAIAKALDTDNAGERNYGPETLPDGSIPEFYTSTVPCTQEFADNVPVLLGNPAALHAVVSADYAARWPDLECPTLADCEAFCTNAILELPCSQSSTSPSSPLQPE